MKKRILFICLGNICRSPAAEGVMRDMIAEKGLSDIITVDSAGIGGWHIGSSPDPRMQKHALRRGYNLSMLRARQFNSSDFKAFNIIVVMDEDNYYDVVSRIPNNISAAQREQYEQKVVKMKDLFEEYKGCDSVPDPYYGGSEGFEKALDLIEDGCRHLLSDLVK